MKAAHLDDEINPFDSAFSRSYAEFSRLGHGLRPALALVVKHGRSRDVVAIEFRSGNRIDRIIEFLYYWLVRRTDFDRGTFDWTFI